MSLITSRDADSSSLEGREIVVLGYGNQGRPQALNLRDSGCSVTVAARKDGRAAERAAADGFDVLPPGEGAATADVLMMLLPDEVQARVFDESVRENLREGCAICFAHGFAVAFGGIESSRHDLVMVAPKGQGARLREAYLEGSGLPCLIAVAGDVSGSARDIAVDLAGALGCLRVGAFETTFREEAVSDIFGEQAVLVGGVPALVKKAFDLLVSRGFSPEVAYFECVHELKIIVDLVSRRGFSGMRDVISGTAAYGGLRYGERLVGEETESEMERLFDRIESGEFARDWLEEAGEGSRTLERMREAERRLAVEKAGKEVRRLFPGEGRGPSTGGRT